MRTAVDISKPLMWGTRAYNLTVSYTAAVFWYFQGLPDALPAEEGPRGTTAVELPLAGSGEVVASIVAMVGSESEGKSGFS